MFSLSDIVLGFIQKRSSLLASNKALQLVRRAGEEGRRHWIHRGLLKSDGYPNFYCLINFYFFIYLNFILFCFHAAHVSIPCVLFYFGVCIYIFDNIEIQIKNRSFPKQEPTQQDDTICFPVEIFANIFKYITPLLSFLSFSYSFSSSLLSVI